jgi:hypothetical protein
MNMEKELKESKNHKEDTSLAYILKPMIRMQNLAWTAGRELLNISPDAYNLSPPCTFQPTL